MDWNEFWRNVAVAAIVLGFIGLCTIDIWWGKLTYWIGKRRHHEKSRAQLVKWIGESIDVFDYAEYGLPKVRISRGKDQPTEQVYWWGDMQEMEDILRAHIAKSVTVRWFTMQYGHVRDYIVEPSSAK